MTKNLVINKMHLTTNSDGGSRGNPGPGAIGVIVRDGEKILESYGKKIGFVTNNVAEYEAVIQALTLGKKYKEIEITCILDSELVVKQLQGKYKISSELLKPLYLTVKGLERNFKRVLYKHVLREDKFQQLADKIVNKTLDAEKKLKE